MRRLRFLPLLALCGCQYLPGGLGAGPTCDKAKLEALASELDGMSDYDATGRVWPGVKEACGDSLTNAAPHLYEGYAFDREKASTFKPDAQYDRMVESACPGWEDEVWEQIGAAPADERALVAYRACNFARFGVLPEERFESAGGIGIVSWSMHAWLLNQGLHPDAARTISRALFALEERVATLGMVPRGVELPVAKGEPIADGAPIVLGKDGVVFVDKKHASIEDGRIDPESAKKLLVTGLYDSLLEESDKSHMMAEARGSDRDSRLLIIADHDTSVEALTQVLYTANRADWDQVSLVVASEDGLEITAVPLGLLPPNAEPVPADGTDGEVGVYRIKGPKHALPEPAGEFDPEAMAREAGLLDADPALEALGEFLSVEIGADGYSVGRGRGTEPLEEVSGHDFGPLAAQAEKLKGEQPSSTTLVLSASADTRIDRLVAAITAGRGQLPRVLLEVERAHQLGAPPKLEDVGSPTVKATVKGKLDEADIHSVVRANIKDVRACYYKGLAKDPELKGLVEINFVIASTGKVPTSVVQSTPLADREVGKCIARAAKKWRFPAPEGGGNVVVTYPFNLSPE